MTVFVPYREEWERAHIFQTDARLLDMEKARKSNGRQLYYQTTLFFLIEHFANFHTIYSITSFIAPIGENNSRALSSYSAAVWMCSGRGGLFRFCHWKWLSHPNTLHIDMCYVKGGHFNWSLLFSSCTYRSF